MKPKIVLDPTHGLLLHLVDAEGNVVHTIPLNAEARDALAAELATALEQMRSPETRGNFLWNVARAVAREVLNGPKKGSDGTSKPE